MAALELIPFSQLRLNYSSLLDVPSENVKISDKVPNTEADAKRINYSKSDRVRYLFLQYDLR